MWQGQACWSWAAVAGLQTVGKVCGLKCRLAHTRSVGVAHPALIFLPPTAPCLCRAFRSRFLELHVEDIPDDELATILEKR